MRTRSVTVVLAAFGLFAVLSSGCSDSPPPAARKQAFQREADAGRPASSPGAGNASLFRLPAIDGKPVTVKTPAALYFFTTWCQYCRQAYPDIQAAADRAKAKGWRVYGIDVGERPEAVANYIQQYRPHYPVLLDQNSLVANQYNVPGYPTFILIDKNANIVYNSHAVPGDF
jgi:thiol-disulfide isomerase/thioredoxin